MITIVKELPICDSCGKWFGYIDSVLGSWANRCLRCWVEALKSCYSHVTDQHAWLGVGRGRLKVTKQMLIDARLKENDIAGSTLKDLCKKLGDFRRYTLLIDANCFVQSQGRDYAELGLVSVISGVVDIAWRLFTYETDIRAEQAKVWLRGEWK